MKRCIVFLFSSLLFVTATPVRAAFTDDLDDLRAELVFRSDARSNSTDKVEQKQKKACDKAIAAIDKSTTLAGDIKAAAKIAKSMEKVFPEEFGPVLLVPNLESFLSSTAFDLSATIQTILDPLAAQISALPDGPAKIKAQAAYDNATNLLAQVLTSLNLADAFKDLASSLKATTASQKIVDKAGPVTPSSGVTATIGGSNFVADSGGGAEWVQSSGVLDIGGGHGTFPNNIFLSVALCSNFNGTANTYPLQPTCGGVTTGSTFFAVTSGTLVISTFNAINTSLSGTFAFSATDGSTSILVTNGQFNLNNLTVTP